VGPPERKRKEEKKVKICHPLLRKGALLPVPGFGCGGKVGGASTKERRKKKKGGGHLCLSRGGGKRL